MSRVRVTDGAYDVSGYQRKTDASTAATEREMLSYEWLRKRINRRGISGANDVEIVVGKHAERRRVLRVREEALRSRGVPSKVYMPKTCSLSDPSFEFRDLHESERLALFVGE